MDYWFSTDLLFILVSILCTNITVNLEVKKAKSSNIFIYQNCFAYLRSFGFWYEFSNKCRHLDGSLWWLWLELHGICSLLFRESGMHPHSFRCLKISVSDDLSSYRFGTTFVKLIICGYFCHYRLYFIHLIKKFILLFYGKTVVLLF